MARILLIDDDAHFAEVMQELLTAEGHQVRWLDNADEAVRLLTGEAALPDVVLLDNKMPRMTGLEFLATAKQRGLRVPIVLITSTHHDRTVIQAMNLGAFAYIIKPLDLEELGREVHQVVRDALAVLPITLVQIQGCPPEDDEPEEESTLIGHSRPMIALLGWIGLAVRHDLPVLILGETGTGKDLVARALHTNSPRGEGPFVVMNCAALPEQLLDSELFGHEVGAFTGAVKLRKGRFEHANGGTVFLDEVGDMPLALQAKLLRVLENREVTRVGSNEPIKVNVRVLAATHRDLAGMERAGTFRQDLFYRLEGATIRLPPLRERADDIPLLVRYFLALAFPDRRARPALHPQALEKLRGYHWPGNVRQLQKVVCRAASSCRGGQIVPEDIDLGEPVPVPPKPPLLDGEQVTRAALRAAAESAWRDGRPELWPLLQDWLLRELLTVGLAQPGSNQSKLARQLGVSRNYLIKQLEHFGFKHPPADD